MSTETYIPDNLFSGGVLGVPTDEGTLEMLQDLTRGTVLGKILRAIGAAAADPGNTGEGTIGGVALGPKSKVGTYTAVCISAAAPSKFSVVDPDGIRLADAEAEAAYAGPIAFEINAYGDPFALGDTFTVAVGAGSGQLKIADSDGVDGTEDFYAILAEDTDATAAATVCPVYLGGEFNESALTFHGTDDADTWREQARDLGFLFRANIAAPDPATLA
jgi:hypothetical protein